MSRPWFPFYVGDYIKDTARLSTEAHGAYLLLMLDYWTKGAAPDDDAVLATIVRVPVKHWKARLRPLLAPLFMIENGLWRHKRIEEELAHAEEVGKSNSNKAKDAANARWGKSPRRRRAPAEHAPSIGQAMPQNAQSQSQSQYVAPNGATSAAPAHERGKSMLSEADHTLAKRIVEAMGITLDYPEAQGSSYFAAKWVAEGWQPDLIVSTIAHVTAKRGKAPNSLKYFEKAIADAHAELARPLPVGSTGPPRKRSAADVFLDLDHKLNNLDASHEPTSPDFAAGPIVDV